MKYFVLSQGDDFLLTRVPARVMTQEFLQEMANEYGVPMYTVYGEIGEFFAEPDPSARLSFATYICEECGERETLPSNITEISCAKCQGKMRKE